MKKDNRRETFLMLVLGNLLAYYVLFILVGAGISRVNASTFEEYEELNAIKQILEIENEKKEANIQNLKKLQKSNEEIENKFFSITNSENIHNFIKKLADKSSITVKNITIIELEEKEDEKTENLDTIEENELNGSEENSKDDSDSNEREKEPIKNKTYRVSIDILGDYKNKIDFIKSMEIIDKTISVVEFETNIDEGQILSKMVIDIFSIKKDEMDKEFIMN